MQTILVVKDRSLVRLVAFALAVNPIGWSLATQTQAASETAASEMGVVVEEVGEGSALEKAGLRPGDVVHTWERLPNPPANPEGDQGMIESVFHWMGLKVEQAPRGTVKLTGQRDGEVKIFKVVPGEWRATVRGRIPKEMLEDYVRGKELIEAEEFEAGVDLWYKVADVAENRATADSRLRRWILFQIGNAWDKAKQLEKAHCVYRSALEGAQDPLATGVIWQAIGDTCKNRGEFEAARRAYNFAQDNFEPYSSAQGLRWGEGLVFAKTLTDLGDLYCSQGWFRTAWNSLEFALGIRRGLAFGSLEMVESLGHMGNLARERGYFDTATLYFEESLEILQKLAPGSPAMSESLQNLGVLASERGDSDRAAEYFEMSLEILQKLPPENLGVADSLANLGILASKRGDLDLAVEFHKKSLEVFHEITPESLDVAIGLSNLGDLALVRGDLDRASFYLEKSQELFQKLAPGSLDAARSLGWLAFLAHKRGDLDRAAEDTVNSLKIFEGMPEGVDMTMGMNNLGLLALDRGILDLADQLFSWSQKHLQNSAPGSLHVAVVLNNLGLVASERGDLDRAIEYQERSLKISRKLAPGRLQDAQASHALACLYRKLNQPLLALPLFHHAIWALETQINRLGGSRDVQADFRAERAAYYQDTIDLSLELQQPGEAFHILERSRAQSFLAQLAERDLVFSDVPEELERRRRHIAARYDKTQAKIAQLNPREQADELNTLKTQLQQLRWDYRDITEKIVKASPKLGLLHYPKPLELDGARQALDPGTVMLSYSVGEKSTRLFVLASEGAALPALDPPGGSRAIRVETLAIGEKDLRRQIQRWNESIHTAQAGDKSGALHSVRILGKRLYEQLVEPVADAVASSERLLIIPDGTLHILPWGALIRETETADETGRSWQYLAEWKPLHTVLSATVYAELKQGRRLLPKPEEEPAPIQLAAFGDPLYPGNGQSFGDFRVRSAIDRGLFDDWKPLPYTRQEVEKIAALYPKETTRTYLGAKATEEAVKAVGRGPRILHLATHGHLDDRFPFDSAVVLTIPQDPDDAQDSDDDRDNGLLQVWEIFERVRLEADLVVLSACASGVGKEQGGEGLIGLTRAFQFAGARSVVASLWNVRDRATAEFMVRFYKYLNAGLTKDEALRAAQLEFIRGIAMEDGAGEAKARDYSAPYYWAPFQIYGDWQ